MSTNKHSNSDITFNIADTTISGTVSYTTNYPSTNTNYSGMTYPITSDSYTITTNNAGYSTNYYPGLFPILSTKEQLAETMKMAMQEGLTKKDVMEMFDLALAEQIIDE